MWKGYLEQESMKSFLDGYKRIDLHTSGHADVDTIKSVIDAVKPEKIIPIHTEVPNAFEGIKCAAEVIYLKDGEKHDLRVGYMKKTIQDTLTQLNISDDNGNIE